MVLVICTDHGDDVTTLRVLGVTSEDDAVEVAGRAFQRGADLCVVLGGAVTDEEIAAWVGEGRALSDHPNHVMHIAPARMIERLLGDA